MNDERLERAARAADERDARVGAEQRKRHGVVHTPPRLAAFVARSVDAALRELGRTGLRDPDVSVIDPACGPGVFLAAALSGTAAPPSSASGQLALPLASGPRVALGFDLDPAALAQANEVLGGEPTARLACADTLASLEVLRAPERAGATLAILGNPPWAGRSENRGSPLLEGLLDDFRRDADGRPLGERKIGVLSDAYVRFWRWSCELARRAEGGAVVALVTNASFLDGPVHRGMRAAMRRWFARVDVLHLGGSALIARLGDRDENLFSVRPAAALTLAVRPADHDERAIGAVRFVAMRGSREDKLARLAEAASLDTLAPTPLAEPARWVPAPRIEPAYLGWPSLPDLMPFHREGVQTNRDAFCVDVERAALLARLRAFADGVDGPWPGRVDVPSAHYDPERARAAVRAVFERDPEASEHVVQVAYRPLDPRWMALIPRLCHRPRPDLLAAMRRSSFALITVRKDRGERPWACFAATRLPPDNCLLSARSSCRARAFPTHGPGGEENLDRTALAAWATRLDAAPSAPDLARYALAVLASPTYRARFDAALRADYPRLPPPPTPSAFAAAVQAGAGLEAAFASPSPGGEPVTIGHHLVPAARAGGLITAIVACERAITPLLP